MGQSGASRHDASDGALIGRDGKTGGKPWSLEGKKMKNKNVM
jgi:hypothetical protein